MRTRPVRLAWGIPPLIALTLGGCTTDEASPVDTLLEAMENDDNQVVDDVSITHDPETGDLSIGGIEITGLDYFQGLDFSPDNDNILIPLTWPVLTLSIGEDPISPISGYRAGVAVLEQTSMATDDENRARFFEEGFLVSAAGDGDVVALGMVEGTVDGSSRSCWWEARRDLGDRLWMVFAGDGVASSVLTASIPIDGPSATQVAADLAEAACGTRPDGS